jgi:hypothetical protein
VFYISKQRVSTLLSLVQFIPALVAEECRLERAHQKNSVTLVRKKNAPTE